MFDLTTLHLQVDPLIRQALQEDIKSEYLPTVLCLVQLWVVWI